MSNGIMQRFKGKVRAHLLLLGKGGMIYDAAGGVQAANVFSNAGVPTNGTNGTLAGFANPGDLLVDTTNGDLYQNVNTLLSPTWTVFGDKYFATKNTITAHAGGGRTNAVALIVGLNRISVCATSADSVVLPASVAGARVTLYNDGAAPAQVFGNGSDTIDGTAGATGVVLTNAKRCIYDCLTAGAWVSAQLGVVSA